MRIDLFFYCNVVVRNPAASPHRSYHTAARPPCSVRLCSRITILYLAHWPRNQRFVRFVATFFASALSQPALCPPCASYRASRGSICRNLLGARFAATFLVSALCDIARNSSLGCSSLLRNTSCVVYAIARFSILKMAQLSHHGVGHLYERGRLLSGRYILFVSYILLIGELTILYGIRPLR